MMRKPVLQLNASREPMRIIPARKALTLVTKGVARVEVPTSIMIYPGVYLPSVICLYEQKHVPYRLQQASRKNIFVRDGYRCLYCGIPGHKAGGLELEHIVPKSRGGRNVWENLVASCRKCNQRKKDRTPEEAGMKLIHRPLPANIHTPRFILRSLGAEINEWSPYLFFDSSGDKRFSFVGD